LAVVSFVGRGRGCQGAQVVGAALPHLGRCGECAGEELGYVVSVGVGAVERVEQPRPAEVRVDAGHGFGELGGPLGLRALALVFGRS